MARATKITDDIVETVRPSAVGPANPEPLKSRRDETLVRVLCMEANAPHGYVAIDATEIPEMPTPAELKAMEFGERKLLENERDAAIRRAEPVASADEPHLVHLRPLAKRQRALMTRWCAELMAAKGQVEILEGTR